jgi:hypothetical protein
MKKVKVTIIIIIFCFVSQLLLSGEEAFFPTEQKQKRDKIAFVD